MARRWLVGGTLWWVLGCNGGGADDAGTGSPGDSSGDATSSGACVDDDCRDGCCAGYGCNFANMCVPCTPAGEILDIDGAGCCEGLLGNAAFVCYAPMCGDDGCPPDVAGCAALDAMHGIHQFAVDCAPEACLATRTLALTSAPGEPGLECAGPDGSDLCMAAAGSLQQYSYDGPSTKHPG